jgi:hypothetical protein
MIIEQLRWIALEENSPTDQTFFLEEVLRKEKRNYREERKEDWENY